jgi:hypothetical protein
MPAGCRRTERDESPRPLSPDKYGDSHKGLVCLLLSGKNSNSDTICKNMTEMRFSKEDIRIIKAVSKLTEIIKDNRKFGLDPSKEDFDEKLKALLGVSPDQKSLIISPAANEKRNKAIVLTREDEDHLYETIYKKLSGQLFEGMGGPAGTGELMGKSETRARFASLSVAKRAVVISELLKETSAVSAERADLTLIGGSAHVNIRHLNNTLTPGTIVLAQSVTGYYDKVIWEVK